MKDNIKIIILLTMLMFFSFINLNGTSFFTNQIIWYVIGFFMMFYFIVNGEKRLIKYIWVVYLILNILLLYLLFFGNTINGSKAWISIMGVNFQPSEFMKITLIILLNKVASSPKYFIKCLILTLIPSVLTFLEPDTGNVIFYLIILFSIVFLKEKKTTKLVAPLVLITFLLSIFMYLYFFYKDIFIKVFGSSFFYRMDRVVSLFDNSSYQLNKALMGIGASSLFGTSLNTSIPEANTDFAFSLLISKIGLIGIVLYLVINLYLNILIINQSRLKIGVMKGISITFLIMKITQESIHELMNIGLFPITGITLPFISYGGTSLLTYFIMMGIISKDNNHLDKDMGALD